MNIVQVNNCDLMGRRFNGHDLHLSLNSLGYRAHQLVLERFGDETTTFSLSSPNELFIRSVLKNLENQLSTNSLIYPFGKALTDHPLFQNADIVHYHMIHNYFLSILDYPKLTNLKPSVWTIHDPWMVTGHCVHPMECLGWKEGCFNCPQLSDPPFPMILDKANQMWKIKKNIFQKMDIDIIVASNLMAEYIKNSPLTEHFKRIHKIPFGIEIEKFQQSSKQKARAKWGITEQDFVIAFRAEKSEIKGLKYIIEMLNNLSTDIPVTLITVGFETLPAYLKNSFRVIELGWQNDQNTLYDFYAASDVFLMPSLAESFGMMAIEAMASGCPVIVFENTVLPEITFAPECGIAVPYKNSDAIRAAIERLIQIPNECRIRGENGKKLVKKHYQYKDYVNRHISLYDEIVQRKNINKLR